MITNKYVQNMPNFARPARLLQDLQQLHSKQERGA
jgi:hypothetical protein